LRSARFLVTPPIFIAFWFLINILPAGLAELTSDEGYYRFLATKLEWGYYDHPPMLPLLVALGTGLIPGELGVRLLNVVFSAAGLFLLFKMIPDDHRVHRLAYLIILSIPLLNYLSILVLPDGPLLLFGLLFLYGYRRFLEQEDVGAVLLMGVAMGLMAYSKYHGALVILFTILSNPRMLRSKAFWGAALIALVMFLPHLWWQYQHDFVTFQYHLGGRARAARASFIFDYVAQQLFAIGPALLFVPFVVKVHNPFERALKFIAAGTLVFFLLTTLRGAVHIHWTSIALYPLILLSVLYYSRRQHRLLLGVMGATATLGVLMRIYLIYQIVPQNHQGIDYYHDRDLWAEDVRALTGTDPVVFFRDYRRAGLYSFYSGEMGVALFPGDDRQSQYELWHYEDSLQTRSVTWVGSEPFGGSSNLSTRMDNGVIYWRTPMFASYYNIRMTTDLPDTIQAGQDSVPIQLTIHNHRMTPVTFPPNHTGGTPLLFVRIRGGTGEHYLGLHSFAVDDKVPAKSSKVYRVVLPVDDLPQGRYTMEFGISADPLGNAYNTPAIIVQVTE
jgi:hypothetical protein